MSEVGGAKRAEYGKLARYTAARSRSVIIVVVGRHTQRFTLFFLHYYVDTAKTLEYS